MKLVKPNWPLAYYLLPPIFFSLIFIIFFPNLTFQLLLSFSIASLLSVFWLLAKNIQTMKVSMQSNASAETIRWALSIIGLIFLLAISGIFVASFTASSQLTPDILTFGKVTKIWLIGFPIGFFCLTAQVMIHFLQSQKIKAFKTPLSKKTAGKNIAITRLTAQQFVGFSGFVGCATSLAIVAITCASAFGHAVGFEIPRGANLQTILGCTLLYLPWTIQRLNQRRVLKKMGSPVKKLLKITCGLIFWIIVLSILTMPLAGSPIKSWFIQYGLNLIQWKLFILGWWISITPFIATQIMQLSSERRIFQEIIPLLILSSGLIYGLGAFFLMTLGENYFLAVIHENIWVVLLGAASIGSLSLNGLRFQQATEIVFSQPNLDKYARHEKYFLHSLVKGTVIACGLYWFSGLSILSPTLLMVTIPSLLLFLFIVLSACHK